MRLTSKVKKLVSKTNSLEMIKVRVQIIVQAKICQDLHNQGMETNSTKCSTTILKNAVQ